MFKWINKQGVTNDEGFTLQRADRFHYEYGYGDTEIRIVVEADLKKENVYVSDAIAEMTEADGLRITHNVAESLKFMGIRFQIH